MQQQRVEVKITIVEHIGSRGYGRDSNCQTLRGNISLTVIACDTVLQNHTFFWNLGGWNRSGAHAEVDAPGVLAEGG